MTNPTVEEHLAEWASQSPTCIVTRAEWDFIHQMRRSAEAGVGFGWMQGIIEVEWTAKHGAHGWGPRYFEGKIAELRAEVLALRAALKQIEDYEAGRGDDVNSLYSMMVANKALNPSTL